ncbi:MAG: D-glycero-beta-D-manno-heptose 1-phosphate adenylyltransferase [Candidatus Krumholzibacteria bacterium]|nr:D-glycero-beta-D-manno-heptose 1-phosphate adenylyltransferase [Candidatus Krumholzibacteria bacterium]
MVDYRDKRLSRSALARFRARNRKKTIVFTNGCFDILHRGHVEILRKAKRLGDILVVGLNSDASVRRLKGRGRPLAGEKDRAFVLAALEAVDRVVIFGEDTPFEAIRALEPDVLVKGAEYGRGEIVGAGFVEERGGRVVRVPMRKGFSTTSLIEKIRR